MLCIFKFRKLDERQRETVLFVLEHMSIYFLSCAPDDCVLNHDLGLKINPIDT